MNAIDPQRIVVAQSLAPRLRELADAEVGGPDLGLVAEVEEYLMNQRWRNLP